MIRAFILIIFLIIFNPVLGQRNQISPDYKNGHDRVIRENLERLQFDWSLPTAYNETMISGLSSLAKGDWKIALSFFHKVIEFDSTFIPAYYYRFCCYEIGNKLSLSNSKPVENIKYISKELTKDNLFIFSDLWDIYVPNKKHINRERPLLQIAPPFFYLSNYLIEHQNETNPDSFDFVKKAASSLFTAKLKHVIQLANKAMEKDTTIQGLYLKATAFQFLSQHDSAFYLYNKILQKDGTVIEAHENLALYKNQLNDKIGVVNHLNSLIKLDPENPNIWRFTGLLKIEVQDYYGGIFYLTKYLKTDSTNFDCLKQLAIAKYQVRSYEESLKDITRAISINNRDLGLLFYQSDNYLKLGDSIECIKVLRDAEKIFGFRDLRLNLFIAKKLVEVNQIKQAQDAVDLAVKYIYLDHLEKQYMPQANLIQCEIFLKKGNVEEALEKLNSFLLKEGEQVDYLFLRARTFLILGEKEKAKIDLKKLVEANFQPAIDLYKTL